jgi:hypothetical protein
MMNKISLAGSIYKELFALAAKDDARHFGLMRVINDEITIGLTKNQYEITNRTLHDNDVVD